MRRPVSSRCVTPTAAVIAADPAALRCTLNWFPGSCASRRSARKWLHCRYATAAASRGPYCTGAFTPSGNSARVVPSHSPQVQAWARCSVESSSCGTGRSKTCRFAGPPASSDSERGVPQSPQPSVLDLDWLVVSAQRPALVPWLPAGLAARPAARAAGPPLLRRRLARPVRGGRIASCRSVHVQNPLDVPRFSSTVEHAW